MNRRELLKKLGQYSAVVGGLALIGTSSQGCVLYDDGYGDYGDVYGDAYGDYADYADAYADYGDAYGDYGDYADYADA